MSIFIKCALIFIGIVICIGIASRRIIPLYSWYKKLIKLDTRLIEFTYKTKLRGCTYNFTKSHNVKALPKLTFKQFLDFYNVNPDSWIFSDIENGCTDIPCKLSSKIIFKDDIYYIGNDITQYYDTHFIFFKTFRDYYKYYKWVRALRNQIQESKIKEQQNTEMRRLCDAVQMDIDAARQNLENVISDTEKVVKRTIKVTTTDPMF